MRIDIEKISSEHKKLFPKATFESQVWKLEEEVIEVTKARTVEEVIKEYADCVIVCIGIYRWCPNLALMMIHLLKLENEANWGKIEEEVIRKWKINLERKWEWNGKTYHHIKKKLYLLTNQMEGKRKPVAYSNGDDLNYYVYQIEEGETYSNGVVFDNVKVVLDTLFNLKKESKCRSIN